jgi:hypothetical protein
MIESGFLSCVFCGSTRVFMGGVVEDEGGKRGLWSPAVAILIECQACQHEFDISITQANEREGSEQVAIGFYKHPCPDACATPAMHQKE